MMLRLLGAWIIDVRTGRGLSPIKQESNRRGWLGRRTGWNRTHVVPLSLTLRCYNYQIKVSVRASIFLCRVVHMEQLEVHQTKQKTSKAYKLLTHHFLLNHSWMHRCFLTWKHLHLWSNMWPQHQQCTVWVEAHCSTFEASQSFFFFFQFQAVLAWARTLLRDMPRFAHWHTGRQSPLWNTADPPAVLLWTWIRNFESKLPSRFQSWCF